ncbi:uncharacterized protein DSM5745_09659 [Aspergillus mulundensis]|uniref:NACHT domain-containing protein n=1 Tax=Aspergillus mulundensis TaxID=1810919 RepID=A0A3D8QW68_9EURO|nr:hypothetical protein DSM5745_09659 [Aspergillus mulundensis]RDW65920.1 hypothetical protein DSM5745_09659 [Aspergillus mulundensis]
MALLHCPSRPTDIDDLIRRLTSPECNAEESKALQALVQDMVETFQDAKKSTYLIEAAKLAGPQITDVTQYKRLMIAFSNAILEDTSDNNVLDEILLRTYALALRRKAVFSADSHNLGAVLDSLHKRLDNATMAAETEKTYHLLCMLGVVLDAMVDVEVTGLDRESLHEPLFGQLHELKKRPEPRLAQTASYAYEALRGVPDNDGPWQAIGRTAADLVTALATVAGTITKLDPTGLLDAAPIVIQLLSAFKTLVDNGKQMCEEAQSLKQAFVHTVRGLTKPRQWYTAVRYCRLFLEAGAFDMLKQILPELPDYKGLFWCGLYAQLEQTWVGNDKLRHGIGEFIEWMHSQETLNKALHDHEELVQWRNMVAGTMQKPHWVVSPSKSHRRHPLKFWKKKQDNPSLMEAFCYQTNVLQGLSCRLLSTAWQGCHKAHNYYADSQLVHYYTQSDRLQIRRISGVCLDLEDCYINLSIVNSAEQSGQRRGELELPLKARLGVDTPASEGIKLPNLFQQRVARSDYNGRPRRMLIRGRAGVGKTTLCKKIVSDFYHGKLWSGKFDRIIWIPLRKLKAHATLEGFFEQEFFSAAQDEALYARALRALIFDDSNKDRTLLLLDGFDEVVGEMNPGGRLVETSQFNRLFKHQNTIMTTRPYAALAHVDEFDLQLETTGFRTHEVHDYVARVVKDETHQNEIRNFIKGHSADLLRIPIQLDILCSTWGDGIPMDVQVGTMTALYQAIEIKLWCRDMASSRNMDDSRAGKYRLRRQIEQEMGNEMKFLESLAFNGLFHNVVEFLPQHRDSLYTRFPNCSDDKLERLSFLRSPDSGSSVYYFIHLTFQEFFAAAYFVRRWAENKPLYIAGFDQGQPKGLSLNDFIQQARYNGRYNVMWRFASGMLSAQPDQTKLCELLHELDAEPRDLLGPAHLNLIMHCFHEVVVKRDFPDGPGLDRMVVVRDGLDLMRSKLEALLSTLPGDSGGIPMNRFCSQMEFPEYFLQERLQHEWPEFQHFVLEIIEKRDRISHGLLQIVSSIAMNPENWKFSRRDAFGVMAKHSESVQEESKRILKHLGPQVHQLWLDVVSMHRDLSGETALVLYMLPYSQAHTTRANKLQMAFQNATISQPTLFSLLVDKRPWFRSLAAYNLEQHTAMSDEGWKIVLDLLTDPNGAVRSSTVEALCRTHNDLPLPIVEAVASILVEGKKGKRKETRENAARCLRNQNRLSAEILAVIEGCILDDRLAREVEYAAVKALCFHGPMSTEIKTRLESIIRASGQPLPRAIKPKAVKLLSRYSTYADDLLNSLRSVPAGVKLQVPPQAVFFFDRFTSLPVGLLQCIVPYLESRRTTYAAANVIRAQKELHPCIFKDLTRLLQHDKEQVRANAAYALASSLTVPRECVEALRSALLSLLNGGSDGTRAHAVRALGNCWDMSDYESFLELLLPFLSSDHWGLGAALTDALLKVTQLPLHILQAIVSRLFSFSGIGSVSLTAVLKAQATLPEAVLKSLLEYFEKRRDPAWGVLETREEFFHMIPHLKQVYLVALFKALIYEAFDPEGTPIYCYFQENTLFINLPARLWEVPMKSAENKERALEALRVARRTIFIEPPAESCYRLRMGFAGCGSGIML